jgi:hypothetical protein
VVTRDGTGLRKLADRGGYEGVTLFLDVPDYHEGLQLPNAETTELPGYTATLSCWRKPSLIKALRGELACASMLPRVNLRP